MSAHIRVETIATDPLGRPRPGERQRVIFVAADGSEVEISHILRGVQLDMFAGQAIAAKFETPFVRVVEVAE